MALLDDINSAKSKVTDRMGGYMSELGPRYSLDNASQAANGSTWTERFLGSDAERLRQLNLLSDAVNDPSWTASLDREASARKDAGFKSADAGHRQGEDTRKTTAAGGGTAGGSWDAVIQAQNAQELANTKAKVTQQVAELKAAGIQNLEEMGRQLLSKALAGNDETGAMNVQTQADSNASMVDGLNTQNDDAYRSLLANGLSGFLSGTVTPAVTGGFQAADRWNSQVRDDYTDARDAGYNNNFNSYLRDTGNNTRSWWGLE